jgi:hypothetical protein
VRHQVDDEAEDLRRDERDVRRVDHGADEHGDGGGHLGALRVEVRELVEEADGEEPMAALAQEREQLGREARLGHLRAALGLKGQVGEEAQHGLEDLVVLVGDEGDELVGQPRAAHLGCVFAKDRQLFEEREHEHKQVGVLAREHRGQHRHETVRRHLALGVDVLGEVEQEVEADVEERLRLALPQPLARLLRLRAGRGRGGALAPAELVPLDLEVDDVHHERADLGGEELGVEVGVLRERVQHAHDVERQVGRLFALVDQQPHEAAEQPLVLHERLERGRLARELEQQARGVDGGLDALVALVDVRRQLRQRRALGRRLRLGVRLGGRAPRGTRRRAVLLMALQISEQALDERALGLVDQFALLEDLVDQPRHVRVLVERLEPDQLLVGLAIGDYRLAHIAQHSRLDLVVDDQRAGLDVHLDRARFDLALHEARIRLRHCR